MSGPSEARTPDVARRLAMGALVVTLIASALAFTSYALSYFKIEPIWDDAFMFQRYAHLWLTEHRIVWNPGGEATYGLTSPLFLLVAVPLRLLTRGNQALAVMLSSMLPAFAFVVAWMALLLRWLDATPGGRWAAVAVSAYGFATGSLAAHAVSGMETTFVLLYATIHLAALAAMERNGTTWRAVIAGVLGGLAFGMRPELTLFALLAPLALAMRAERPGVRRSGWIALAITAGLVACHLVVNTLYFHTPLPLPFYAKSLDIYGAAFRKEHRGVTTLELIGFVTSFWPLFAILAVDVMRHGIRTGRSYLRVISPLELAALVFTVICVLYHWIVVLPVMGFSSRFYYPVLPALLYLAARSIDRIGVSLWRGGVSERGLYLGCAGAMAFLWVTLFPAGAGTMKNMSRSAFAQQLGHLDVERHAKGDGVRSYWYKLDEVAKLPDDVVIASTEVGMLGVIVLHKQVLDLAGLNERSVALAPFSGDRFLSEHRPDWIYMPHPHYVAMIDSLRKSKAFRGYDEFPAGVLGTKLFGVALRRDSKRYKEMRALIQTAPRGR